MFRINTLFSGRRLVVAGVAVAMFASAGIAAAAEGGAPWSAHIAVEPTVTAPAVTEPAPAAATTTVVDVITTSTDAPESGPATTVVAPGAPAAGDAPVNEPTSVAVEQPSLEPTTPTPTTPPAHHEPVTTEPAVTEPATTQPVVTEPQPTPAPTTTEFHDTVVPQALSLNCLAEGSTVTCHWTGTAVPGFAKFLVLRGDGGSKGRVPFQSSDPSADTAIDPAVPAGSYSYVVVVVDGNSKTLVHSNPVFLEIGATG